jgi:hypothetical protein
LVPLSGLNSQSRRFHANIARFVTNKRRRQLVTLTEQELQSRFKTALIASAFCLVAVCGVLPASAADRSSYSGERLTIKSVEQTDSGNVQITYTTMPETLYYCPGANETKAAEGKVLTFVRAFFKQKPKVKYPAKAKGDPAKTADKQILVDAKGKPLFVKSGDELVKIYPVD